MAAAAPEKVGEGSGDGAVGEGKASPKKKLSWTTARDICLLLTLVNAGDPDAKPPAPYYTEIMLEFGKPLPYLEKIVTQLLCNPLFADLPVTALKLQKCIPTLLKTLRPPSAYKPTTGASDVDREKLERYAQILNKAGDAAKKTKMR